MENNKNENGIVLTKGKLVIIFAVAVALIIAGIFIGANWNKETDSSPDTSTIDSDIDPNASDYSDKNPTEPDTQSTGIKIPGYPSITIAANTTDVTMALLNPEGNPCYFTFEIVLDDTGETIYKSKMVPPGQSISNVTLTKSLSVGEYKATIKVSTASLNGYYAMNGANVKTVLIAK